MNTQRTLVAVPVPKIARVSNASFGASYLYQNPGFSHLVMGVIAVCSDVDNIQELILAKLLQGEGSVYKSITKHLGGGGQKEDLTAKLIASKTNADDLTLFKRVRSELKKVKRVRNDFAHGVWGRSSEYPDDLLLADGGYGVSRYAVGMELTARKVALKTENELMNILSEPEKNALAPDLHKRLSMIAAELSNDPIRKAAIDRFFDRHPDEEVQLWSLELLGSALSAAVAGLNTMVGFQICLDRPFEETRLIREQILDLGLLEADPKRLLT